MLELLTTVLLLQSASTPSCITADTRVEELIAKKGRELRGHEYCQFRSYETLSDVDGDGVEDFLVLFTIEGVGVEGNKTIQFLAVFASGSKWRPSVREVGRRGEKMAQSILRGPSRAIRLEMLEYGPSDAMCCPSRKGELRLVFQDGEIGPFSK